jgi:hypothetical protein
MEFENLLYPLGREELSALVFLRDHGADWLGDNVNRILQIEEQNFATASATITIAQDIQKGLAQAAETPLLHINSGLFALGASLQPSGSSGI